MPVVYTKDEYIEKVSKIYNSWYSYSKLIYTNLEKKIIVTCPIHGDFVVGALNHLYKHSCCKQCDYIDRYNNYLKTGKNKPNLIGKSKLNELNKVIHSNIKLVNGYTPQKRNVEVIDKQGIKYNISISSLLKGKFPTKSNIINKTFAFSLEFYKIHPNLILTGEYINNNTKITFKDSLGIIYALRPSEIRKGSGPDIRNVVDPNKCFSIKANLVHNNKYNYDKVEYKGAFKKVVIYCNEHKGDFLQVPSNHLNGNGCPKCSLRIGYKRSQFIHYCKNTTKNITPTLYIIRCFNDTEDFLKIGITTRTLSQRFFDTLRMPYSYEVLKEIKGSPDFVWNKEKELHTLCRPYQHKPLISFGGETECFDLSCKQLLQEYL